MNELANKIKEADLVLVGIGEELEQLKKIRKSKKYKRFCEISENFWVLPFVEKLILEDIREERAEIYKKLAVILKNKNYFMVSVCQDGLIRYAELDDERIVEPCGGYYWLQCSEKCNTELYDVPKELLEQIREFMNGKISEIGLVQPICPVCGKPLVFNNISADHYNEDGYLKQWEKYKKWLQGTINKNLCILELGVGMKYPSVIRWPFEKVAFFNHKASLYRVHSWLYQISEEIKDKGYGVCQEPEEFIMELYKAF